MCRSSAPHQAVPCSVLLQVFGFGPDETAHFRLVLFKVPVLDAVVSSMLYAFKHSARDFVSFDSW